MIIEIFQIFKARNDKALAARLALKLAQGQLLDRVTTPVLFAQIALWLLFTVLGVIAISILIAAANFHWTLGLPVLVIAPLLAGLYFAAKGLSKGMNRVQNLIDAITDRGMDSILPPSQKDLIPTDPTKTKNASQDDTHDLHSSHPKPDR